MGCVIIKGNNHGNGIEMLTAPGWVRYRGEWVRRRVESGVGAVISGGFAMSPHPQKPLPPVPEQTARIARAAFPKSSPYLTLRGSVAKLGAGRESGVAGSRSGR